MTPEQSGSRELNTWKDIADYLKVSVRTAQTYKRRGLPVYQFGEGGRVVAYSHELDDWKRQLLVSVTEAPAAAECDTPAGEDRGLVMHAGQTGQRWPLPVIVMTAAFAVAAMVWWWASSPPGVTGPQILSVAPAPVPSLNGEQRIVVSGRGFRPGAYVVLIGTPTKRVAVSEVVENTGTGLTVLADLGVGPSSWTAQVVNADGARSNRFPLSIAGPPTPAPEITGIAPNPVVGSNVDQLVTFFGKGFDPGLTMMVRVGGRAYRLSGAQIVFVGGGRTDVLIKVTTVPAEWTAEVVNPTGATSTPFPFRVVAPTASGMVGNRVMR